jgi:hypothetical protein
MIKCGIEARPLRPQPNRKLLDFSPSRHKHGDSALLLDDPSDIALVEELFGLLRENFDFRLEGRIERLRGQHLGAVQVLCVESRIHRRTQPDEPATSPLTQRQTQFQLGRRLVDLIHDDRVTCGNQIVLKPAPGDAGGDDHDIPAGSFRGCFPLAIDHPDLERLPQDLLGYGANPESLAGPGPCDDTERLALPGPLTQLGAVLPLQEGVHLDAERQLDRLAGGAGRSDDDNAALGMGRMAVSIGVRREMMVAGGVHGEG